MTSIHSGQLKSGPWLLDASIHEADSVMDLGSDGADGDDDKLKQQAPSGPTQSGGSSGGYGAQTNSSDWSTGTDPHAPSMYTPAMPTTNWGPATSGGGGTAPSSSGAGGGSGAMGTPGGGPPSQSLTEALTRAGIDPALHPLISGFSATEGNNPSGAPTLGFTDSQAGTSLDQHAQALARQLQDRQSVAGPFPHAGTPQQQASWMATVVGQNGSPSDWQGNAQPARSTYVNNIVKSMPIAPAAPAAPLAPPIHSGQRKSGAWLLEAFRHVSDHDDTWEDASETGAGIPSGELTSVERDKLLHESHTVQGWYL
jgi:hypothetical protein